jgi:4-amino-4-deoxy-L-arabinose transferase-like glycosyltransferase
LLTYLLAEKLFDRRVAWIGALIFATSPFLIWYAQEARYITLAVMTSLLATYSFLHAVKENRSGWWFLYFSSTILTIAAFFGNIFLPIAQGLWLLSSRLPRRVRKKWLLGQFIVFLVVMWWANGGSLTQLDGYWKKAHNEITVENQSGLDPARERLASGGRREFSFASVPYTFFTFSAGFSVGPSLPELHKSRSVSILTPHAPILILYSVVFGGIFLFGIWKALRDPRQVSLLGLWLGIPLIGVLAISALTEMSFNVRYLSASLPAYLLILAVGISDSRRWVQIALLISVLLAHAYSLANYYFEPRYARADARSAAQYLEAAAGREDIILVIGNSSAVRYYYKGVVPIVRFGAISKDNSVLDTNLRALVKQSGQLWIVEIRPWETDPEGNVKAALDNLSRAVQRASFPGVEIYSYQLSTRQS